jgi:hypothetical protein
MTVLALIENIKGRFFHELGRCEWTQSGPTGLVLRVIMIAPQQFAWDVQESPPTRIPALRECLAYLADATAPPTQRVTQPTAQQQPSFYKELPRRKRQKREKKWKKHG